MDRLVRLRTEIRKRGWDAVWISKTINRQYLSGFTGTAGWLLIPAQGKPVLITDGRYTEQAQQETAGFKIVISQKDPLVVLAELLEQKKIVKLGFEDSDVTVAAWKKIKSLNKKVRGFSLGYLIEQIRAVKEPDEIKSIQKAIKIAENAFNKVSSNIKPGISERSLAFDLEKYMLQGGGEGIAFPTIVAAGARSSLPHAKPTDQRLKVGDLLVMDFGCRVNGYHSDLTRTMAVGKMTERQQEMYKIVKKAQKSAQKVIYSGQKCFQSDLQARLVFKQANVEKYFIHSLGHGLGQEVHELPRLASSSKDTLLPGMIVTCEPGLYLPGWGGIRIEDDVLVEETQAKWLSQSPEELQVIGKKLK